MRPPILTGAYSTSMSALLRGSVVLKSACTVIRRIAPLWGLRHPLPMKAHDLPEFLVRVCQIIWVGDAAIRDVIVGVFLGHGIAENGQLACVALLPVAPRQLVPGSVDEHDLKDGAEDSLGFQMGGWRVGFLRIYRARVDDFTSIAIEHAGYGGVPGRV